MANTNVHQTILKRDAQGEVCQNSYGDFKMRAEYDGSNNMIYIGLARPGAATNAAVWQIRKMTYTGTNMTQINWPQGSNSAASSEFNFAWDSRAGYVYS